MAQMYLRPNSFTHSDTAAVTTSNSVDTPGRSGTIDDDTLYTVQNPTNQELWVEVAPDASTFLDVFFPSTQTWLVVYPKESLVIKKSGGERFWFRWVHPNITPEEAADTKFFQAFQVAETAIPE